MSGVLYCVPYMGFRIANNIFESPLASKIKLDRWPFCLLLHALTVPSRVECQQSVVISIPPPY